MRRLSSLSAFIAAGALFAALPALAQSFTGAGPVRPLVLPTEPRGETTPASTVAPAAAQATPVRAEAPSERIRRLPATLRGYRFAGEWAQNDWPIVLTAAQARRPARFQLAFLSAISVMPEGSRLTLTVNDRVVARMPLAAPDAVAQRSVEIPAGLLTEGANAIRITVDQRHRVDCTLAATYELWTALDAARSGLVLAGDDSAGAPQQPADIAAIGARADGATSIRLVMTGKLTPEAAERALMAAQIATLASRALQPAVEFVAAGRDEPGLDLVVGTASDLAARPDMADLGSVSGPRYGFLPARAGRAPTFVVTGTDSAQVDEALKQWDAERTRLGAGAGSLAGLKLLAARRGVAVDGAGARVGFAEAGFTDTEFAGRLMRVGLDLDLPADYLPADYDRVVLGLAGGHGRGLTGDALVGVEINGRKAATQMLARDRDASLDANQIFLPLGLMRPGVNRIEVVAQVPRAGDDSCLRNDAGDTRLTLLGRSGITLPRLARIGRAPELAMLAAGALPFADADARPLLFVPTPDRNSMAAAATLAARLAVSAGRPVPFGFTMTAPPLGTAPVLLVGPAPALERGWLRAAGLDPDRIKTAWQTVAGEKRPLVPLPESEALARRCALPPAPAGAAPVRAPAAEANPFGLPSLSFWQPGPAPGSRDAATVVAGSTALLVGQDFPAGDARHLWTVVTAPDAAALQSAVQCLTHPQIWNGLGGRISALDADETIGFVPAGDRQRFVSTQGFGFANLRLVAAGWLSLNPLAYIGLALALVLCLAASTLWLIVNTGRRQE